MLSHIDNRGRSLTLCGRKSQADTLTLRERLTLGHHNLVLIEEGPKGSCEIIIALSYEALSLAARALFGVGGRLASYSRKVDTPANAIRSSYLSQPPATIGTMDDLLLLLQGAASQQSPLV